MPKLKKSYITMTIVILSTFFVTVIIALNMLNSQIGYTSERNYIEKQIHYSAYAGIEKAIAEIKYNKGYQKITTISLENKSDNYTILKVTHNAEGEVYTYTVESTGYGRFKDQGISEKITAKITVDYKEKSGIIKIDHIEIE